MFRFRIACSWMSTLRKSRVFCTTTKNNSNPSNTKNESNLVTYNDSYKQLDNLDFMTAAKILFADPPKKKEFGLDFHLVQFFFACLPSLAVYLVAQYARYEIRRMEAELEQKKKKEEQEKAKEEELNPTEEKEVESVPEPNSELLEVKVRLEKLEEVVKEIAVGSADKRPAGSVSENQKENHTADKPSNTTSNPSSTSERKQSTKQTPNLVEASDEDQKGKNQSAGASEDSKK